MHHLQGASLEVFNHVWVSFLKVFQGGAGKARNFVVVAQIVNKWFSTNTRFQGEPLIFRRASTYPNSCNWTTMWTQPLTFPARVHVVPYLTPEMPICLCTIKNTYSAILLLWYIGILITKWQTDVGPKSEVLNYITMNVLTISCSYGISSF